MAEKRPKPFGCGRARIAQVQLVVSAAELETSVGDGGVEALDGRTLRCVRADMEDLGDPALGEALDAEPRCEARVELVARGRECAIDLVLVRLVGDRHEQRPAPGAMVAGEDRVEIGRPVGRPPEPFERPDLREDAAILEGELEPVGGRVEPRHAGREGVGAGRPVPIDHDEPAWRQVQEADDAGRAAELRCAIERTIEGRGRMGDDHGATVPVDDGPVEVPNGPFVVLGQPAGTRGRPSAAHGRLTESRRGPMV